MLVDPSEREERVMDGKMVIGMNKHREICTLQMTGSMLLLKEQVRVYFEPACQQLRNFWCFMRVRVVSSCDLMSIIFLLDAKMLQHSGGESG